MGYAIAETLANYGAKVYLISGPVNLSIKHANIERIDVLSALEMYEKATELFPKVDGAIMSAAVADYRVAEVADQKIKHQNQTNLSINLLENPDIAAALGVLKKEHQLLIGFALETNDELENAQKKLKKKQLDFIVLNSLNDKGAGFGHDTNKISIVESGNKITKYELKSKKDVSLDIVNRIIELLID
jgi:phosphopantothenoylcysteine decarboxylase/phosphopantothenate--cysteine ligase